MPHLHHPLAILVSVAAMVVAPALVTLRAPREADLDNIDYDFQED